MDLIRLSETDFCGLLNEAIQRKLFTEENLTFKCAVEIGIDMGTAAKDFKELHGGVTMEIGINE